MKIKIVLPIIIYIMHPTIMNVLFLLILLTCFLKPHYDKTLLTPGLFYRPFAIFVFFHFCYYHKELYVPNYLMYRLKHYLKAIQWIRHLECSSTKKIYLAVFSMLVSANDTTANTTKNVLRARPIDLIYCITSFEESHCLVHWFSHSSFVERSIEFNFGRMLSGTVFEEMLLHFYWCFHWEFMQCLEQAIPAKMDFGEFRNKECSLRCFKSNY